MYTVQEKIILDIKMNAVEKLINRNKEEKFICVGLDSDIDKIPAFLKEKADPIYEFNKAIIEACAEFAAAFKINFAFYEREGNKGLLTLEKTLSIIPSNVLTIADAKRGDIGNTSQMYSKAILEKLNFDSITVNPYMGEDSIRPFLQNEDKLVFVLVLTSNPGASDFEKLKLEDGSFLFQKVIEKVKIWNSKNNCGIVFGATKSEELLNNIEKFENLPVLLPGIGAQGGSLEDVVRAFKMANKFNFILNVSRGIIYKSNKSDFATAARNELLNLNNSIKDLLSR